MIRVLAADEMTWFVRQALTFAGHADPGGLALRLRSRLRDAARDAAGSHVLFEDGEARAGAHVGAPARGDMARILTIASVWHDGNPGALARLLGELLDRNPHEEVRLPLHLLPEARCRELEELLAPLGFRRDRLARMRFQLSEVPPLGTPLVLEAYTQRDERAFRDVFQEAEGVARSDARWALLKRRSGPFHPDLWFLARETLDQEPVGYAFCGSRRRGVDANYTLDAAGVLQRYRGDSEMLRRLVLTTLHELSGRGPVGEVEVLLGADDPKLIEILASLGFETVERIPLLLKGPA